MNTKPLPKQFEDVYPLSPVQQGMLLHTLYDPTLFLYFEQLAWDIKLDHGSLNCTALEQAWQQVVDRHSVLRTAFVWENIEQPLQIVVRNAKVPFTYYDWRQVPAVDQAEKLQAFFQADRQRGFKLTKAPLMRLTVFQLTETTYRCLWSYHHILLDGWSLPLVFREVLAYYEEFLSAKGVSTPAALSAVSQLLQARPYRDYIAWLQQQDLSQAESFWRQLLQGFTTPTFLAIEKSTISTSDEADIYAQEKITLTTPTAAALKSLAQQHQLTLSILIQGAWALLLSYYSRDRDIVFGVTISGRPTTLTGAESMIGLFINTLPIRVKVDPEISLIEWLLQLQLQQAELYQYEYSPLAEIQAWSDIPRGVPLFNSIVVVENYRVDASLWQDNKLFQIHNVHAIERTNYPLTLGAIIQPELTLEISYDRRRFDGSMVCCLLQQLQTLLETMVLHPEQRLAEFSLRLPPEQQQALEAWNQTQQSYPQQYCLHQLFTAQATQTPDAIALICNQQQITYQHLDQHANELAQELQNLGVRPERSVALCTDRSPAMIVALLGILKAGGICLPLDPSYPKERLAFMLADAQPPVLVTQASLLEQLPEHSAQVICLDERQALGVRRQEPGASSQASTATQRDFGDEREQIAQDKFKIQNPKSKIQNPDSTAYIFYTSGSTGRPRGVMVSHQALVNHSYAIAHNYELSSSDRVLQFASSSFDVAIEELFPTWLQGGTVVLRADATSLAFDTFTRSIQQHQLTVLNLPAPYWHEWVQTLSSETFVCPSLRLVVTGSDQVLAEQFTVWQKTVDRQIDWRNAYGLTEAAITTTVYQPDSQQAPPQVSVMPIGKPIANTQTYLLDDQLQPVPIGMPGELYIGGDGLARGYLHQPARTAERFIPNPFIEEGGNREQRSIQNTLREEQSSTKFKIQNSSAVRSLASRLYKTGDRARFLPDGNLEYLGRADQQVKIRGFRIELTEIEARLNQHPEVQAAVVTTPKDDTQQQPYLAAYLVPTDAAIAAAPQATDKTVELWPSVGEYPLYDELLYFAMTSDESRNRSYQIALQHTVKDQVVVEIGTGKDAILARFCVAAGAKHIYAIELDPTAYAQAQACVAKLDLADKITLLQGDARQLELPELADVCVSEIIGTIGGSEGAAVILNQARRFLKPHGVMVPQRCLTQIAAVSLPAEVLAQPGFAPVPAQYTQQVFDHFGYPFDLRLCVKHFPTTQLLSSTAIFEDLQFDQPVTVNDEHAIELVITQPGHMDGVLLWIELRTIEQERLDILEQDCSWLPVYWPLFSPGIEVAVGDRLEAICQRQLCEDQVHPDYALKGRLVRQSGEVIEFSDASYHHRPVYQHQPFYERLWSQPVGRARPDDAAQALIRRLRDDLRQALPDYMVPAAFTLLADLPYLPNGKVDRQRLPVPEASRLTSAVAYVAPQSEIEQKIAAVWQALLPVEHVGIHDNFFDLGGNSLLMIQAYNQLTQIFSQDLLMVDLFKYSTVSMLAEHFSQAQQGSPDQPTGMAEPAEKQVLTQAQVATRKTATSRQRDLRRSHRNRLAGGN